MPAKKKEKAKELTPSEKCEAKIKGEYKSQQTVGKAAELGDLIALEELLHEKDEAESKALVNELNAEQNSPVNLACREGQLDAVKKLVSSCPSCEGLLIILVFAEPNRF